jgi:hypothetical protein
MSSRPIHSGCSSLILAPRNRYCTIEGRCSNFWICIEMNHVCCISPASKYFLHIFFMHLTCILLPRIYSGCRNGKGISIHTRSPHRSHHALQGQQQRQRICLDIPQTPDGGRLCHRLPRRHSNPLLGPTRIRSRRFEAQAPTDAERACAGERVGQGGEGEGEDLTEEERVCFCQK